MPLVPIAPGNTPVFKVTPTFSGAPFAPVAANASVTSSDPVNFPVELVPADATGLSFQATIPNTVKVTETVSVVWRYANADGTTAVVGGTVTLVPAAPADDITGGGFTQTT